MTYYFASAITKGVCSVPEAAGPMAGDGPAPGRVGRPLTLYVVADAHVGQRDRGEQMMAFAELCNRRMPDVVIDLGDCIQGEITPLYPEETIDAAALAQQRDWFAAWDKIRSLKEVALGNRDTVQPRSSPRHSLPEQIWVDLLGDESRPRIGGTRMQASWVAETPDVKALLFVLASYAEGYNRSETLQWLRKEASAFDGDFIVFFSHSIGPYRRIRDVLAAENIRIPALFLHGHNHGPDTLVRDAWGRESEDFPFPAYLVTNLARRDPVVAKFRLHRDGQYETFRIDVRTGDLSEPVLHYQTRVREP